MKAVLALVTLTLSLAATAQVAVKGKTVYTMAGPPIKDGVVVVRNGKIAAVGPASQVTIPAGFKVLEAEIVTPGLVDARATAGLTGIYNDEGHDQDMLDRSAPMQPELRALDAYNPNEDLVGYLRSFGITTLHVGPAPGEMISGQSIVVKTRGKTVDEALVKAPAMVFGNLGPEAFRRSGSPGNRSKQVAMLRAELIRVREAMAKPGEKSTDLRREMLIAVLRKETPLLITADRAQDIAGALRLAKEFGFNLVLDSAAESYLLLEAIAAAKVPVIVHPTMARNYGDKENAAFDTAAKLRDAGIRVACQSGFEDYVPKVRVVLFEAAIAAAHGLGIEGALRTITIDAARIVGVADRVGSLEVGKDGDIALYDGDPFETTSHCIGVIIEGEVVSEKKR